MDTAKPKRIKFSEEEKFLILEEFSLRKDILIPKSGRYKNTLARQRAWEEIAAAVNSLSPLVQRTPEEIRKKWENMVISARREVAVEKHPLLRQRPQERLFQGIFALFNKPGPGLPHTLLPTSAFRARAASGTPALPRVLKDTPDLLLHGQSGATAPGRGLLCPTGIPPAPGPILESILRTAIRDPSSKESLLLAGSQDSMERRLRTPSTAPSVPRPPTAEVLQAAAPHPASLQGPGAAGITPVLPAGSSEHPPPFRIKSPPSPALAWPFFSAPVSPAMQSREMGSPGTPAPEDNGSPSALEGCQPGLRGCVSMAGDWWEKQSQLQTEILELQKETLELQKETLLLQKEKILLEKEKLLLEIIKLRKELGT